MRSGAAQVNVVPSDQQKPQPHNLQGMRKFGEGLFPNTKLATLRVGGNPLGEQVRVAAPALVVAAIRLTAPIGNGCYVCRRVWWKPCHFCECAARCGAQLPTPIRRLICLTGALRVVQTSTSRHHVPVAATQQGHSLARHFRCRNDG